MPNYYISFNLYNLYIEQNKTCTFSEFENSRLCKYTGREGFISMPPRRHTALGKPSWTLWDKQELCHHRNTGSREREIWKAVQESAWLLITAVYNLAFPNYFEREKLKLFRTSPSREGKAGAMG